MGQLDGVIHSDVSPLRKMGEGLSINEINCRASMRLIVESQGKTLQSKVTV